MKKAKTKTKSQPKRTNKSILIGVVTSRFNEDVTDRLLEGALQVLEEAGARVLSVKVPGAVEIPLAAKALLEMGCEGVVALGAVIRGETSHYDYVCNSVERGVSQLMLEIGKPIGFGVLTTESEEQALDRVAGKHGHKGAEAAQVVLEMVGLLRELKKFKK
jgi:6,7-dimethyl-8-ribityllumazine synthase